ncbi:MAG TPA: SDR family oxidoreductase [Bacteroidota bacterium]|nr:SDR family oxidoreductase [Bacteroidota bacterium]
MSDAPSFQSLRGKNCIITGGGGVIGRALCEGLAKVGVNLAIIDVAREEAEKLASSYASTYGVKAMAAVADVLDKSSLQGAKNLVTSRLGPIHLLINCAGGNSPKATTRAEFVERETVADLSGTFYGLDVDGFRKVFDLNFLGTILPTMVFTEDMVREGGGVVLNISSMNAFRPLTKIPAYSAAKASINNFTEWLAVHLAKANIRVNAIAPGFLLTNQNRFLMLDEKTNALTERGQKVITGTPMGRFGEPEELQGITLFLLSDLSKFITGVVVPVDGGFNAYSGV